MVLENLFQLQTVRKHPVFILLQSFAISSIAIWIAFAIFPSSASIASLALTTIGLVPIIQSLLQKEEEEEVKSKKSTQGFFRRHFDLLQIFGWFFIGLSLSYTFWFLVLPDTTSTQCIGSFCADIPTKGKVFGEQLNTLNSIRGAFTAWNVQTACAQGSTLSCTEYIFTNNAVVLGLAIILSFLLGAGAIFLLAWNASVLGVLFGQIGSAAKGVGLHAVLGSIIIDAVGRSSWALLEIGGYFLGVIAGGIISASIAHGDVGTPEFDQIVKDVILLIAVAFILVLAGAYVESLCISKVVCG
ncbi:MAG: hypothetical protein V1847_04525 [Candidatus Diapherotrites archaeon]